MAIRFSRSGRVGSPVGAGRALPRSSPKSSFGISKLKGIFKPSRSSKFGSQAPLFQLDASRTFFTSKPVILAVDRATRVVLSKFGAFIRQRARTSIRRRNTISSEGSPPSSHTGLLRRGIFFGYDVKRQSVIVGPVPLARHRRVQAPPALEYGGYSEVKQRAFSKGFRKEDPPPAESWVIKYISKRPFMNPAMRAELPGLPRMWRDSVKAR